jgi:TolA-binding protein
MGRGRREYNERLMKTSERRRLKENELSHVLSGATTRLTENKREFGLVAAIVALVLVAAGGYWAWKTRTETQAHLMLSEAIAIAQAPVEEPKPGAKPGPRSYATIRARAEAAQAKFTEVYGAYPSTRAGIAARYYAAAALAMLGKPAEAAARYQEVVDRAGTDDFYGRMAKLGIIEASHQGREYDKAISAAQALVNDTDEDIIPRDALLMELGRVQAAAGKKAEAKQTLDKVIAEFPDSAYIEEAKKLLAGLT